MADDGSPGRGSIAAAGTGRDAAAGTGRDAAAGTGRDAAGSRPWRGLGAVLALLAALACFLVAAWAVGASARGTDHVLVGLLVVAAGAALLGIVLLWVAVQLEHAARAGAHARRGSEPRETGSRPASHARLVAGVLLVLCMAVLLVATLSVRSQSRRSAYTQAHGVSRVGTVTAVHRVTHTTKYSSWATYDFDLALDAPVSGRLTSRLHDPTHDERRYDVGATVAVLVDPREPAYAERPGASVGTQWWWLVPLVPALVFALLAGAVLTSEVNRRRAGAARRTPRRRAPPQSA